MAEGERERKRERESERKRGSRTRLETFERGERARSETLLDFRADYLKIVEGTLRYIIFEEEAVEIIVNLRGMPVHVLRGIPGRMHERCSCFLAACATMRSLQRFPLFPLESNSRYVQLGLKEAL